MRNFFNPTKYKLLFTGVIIFLAYLWHEFIHICFDCEGTIGIPFPFYFNGISGWGTTDPRFSVLSFLGQIIFWYLLVCLVIFLKSKFKNIWKFSLNRKTIIAFFTVLIIHIVVTLGAGNSVFSLAHTIFVSLVGGTILSTGIIGVCLIVGLPVRISNRVNRLWRKLYCSQILIAFALGCLVVGFTLMVKDLLWWPWILSGAIILCFGIIHFQPKLFDAGFLVRHKNKFVIAASLVLLTGVVLLSVLFLRRAHVPRGMIREEFKILEEETMRGGVIYGYDTDPGHNGIWYADLQYLDNPQIIIDIALPLENSKSNLDKVNNFRLEINKYIDRLESIAWVKKYLEDNPDITATIRYDDGVSTSSSPRKDFENDTRRCGSGSLFTSVEPNFDNTILVAFEDQINGKEMTSIDSSEWLILEDGSMVLSNHNESAHDIFSHLGKTSQNPIVVCSMSWYSLGIVVSSDGNMISDYHLTSEPQPSNGWDPKWVEFREL